MTHNEVSQLVRHYKDAWKRYRTDYDPHDKVEAIALSHELQDNLDALCEYVVYLEDTLNHLTLYQYDSQSQ